MAEMGLSLFYLEKQMYQIDPSDIIGEKFGKLVVKEYDGYAYPKLDSKRKYHFYICKCECGKEKKN